MTRIAVIPGDGIGVEVIAEALKALSTLTELSGKKIETVEFDYGADRYIRDGTALPADALDRFRSEFDAILLGALGDPRIPDMKHAVEILYGIRSGLDLYANMRPVKLLDRRLSPLKGVVESDVDFTVFRENVEDLYVGIGGTFKKETPDGKAIQESETTRGVVERILDAGFRFAVSNGLKRLTMSEKSNALRFTGDLWQKVFVEVAGRYPQIEAEHLYVDSLAMALIKEPSRFDVIVTSNIFGDIITDLGAQLQGGLGIAASGNINPKGTCMFEPVHGSAPKYAGKNLANPFAAILSLQMLLDHLGFKAEAILIEAAIRECIREDDCTPDIGGQLGTKEAGESVCRRLRELA